jgi:hypothetical protein
MAPPPPRPQFGGINIPGAPKFEFRNFVAPDKNSLLNDPGYQARVMAGQQGLERSAAAKGLLRTGGTLQGISDYNQASGAQEYGNAYARGLQAYDRDYNVAKDAFAPQFAHWQQRADAAKQGGLLGYQTDLNHWLQVNAPKPQSFDPGPDFSELLGDEPLPPPGGGYDPGGYGGGGYDDRERYRGY